MKKMLNTENLRAFKGFWRQSGYQFRNKLLIFTVIMASFLLFNAVHISLQVKSGALLVGSGFLCIGSFITGAILWINALFEGDGRKIKSRLAFPISRKVYLIGSFIAMVRDIIGLLVATSIFAALEILMFKLIKNLHPELMVVNLVDLVNYWDGFWISFSIAALFYALCYCLGICFARARIRTSIVVGILLVLFANRFIYLGVDRLFLDAVFRLIVSPALPLFYLKTWLLTICIFIMSYLALRKVEV